MQAELLSAFEKHEITVKKLRELNATLLAELVPQLGARLEIKHWIANSSTAKGRYKFGCNVTLIPFQLPSQN